MHDEEKKCKSNSRASNKKLLCYAMLAVVSTNKRQHCIRLYLWNVINDTQMCVNELHIVRDLYLYYGIYSLLVAASLDLDFQILFLWFVRGAEKQQPDTIRLECVNIIIG